MSEEDVEDVFSSKEYKLACISEGEFLQSRQNQRQKDKAKVKTKYDYGDVERIEVQWASNLENEQVFDSDSLELRVLSLLRLLVEKDLHVQITCFKYVLEQRPPGSFKRGFMVHFSYESETIELVTWRQYKVAEPWMRVYIHLNGWHEWVSVPVALHIFEVGATVFHLFFYQDKLQKKKTLWMRDLQDFYPSYDNGKEFCLQKIVQKEFNEMEEEDERIEFLINSF